MHHTRKKITYNKSKGLRNKSKGVKKRSKKSRKVYKRRRRGGMQTSTISEDEFQSITDDINNMDDLTQKRDKYLENTIHITNCNSYLTPWKKIDVNCATNKFTAYGKRALVGRQLYDALESDSDQEKMENLQTLTEIWTDKAKEKRIKSKINTNESE